jgi:signal transduction histidine kinase
VLVIGLLVLGSMVAILLRELATHRLLTRSLGQLDTVLEETIPGVEMLSKARAELRALRALAQDVGVVVPGSERERIRGIVDQRLGAFKDELSRYRSLTIAQNSQNLDYLDDRTVDVCTAANLIAEADTPAAEQLADERVHATAHAAEEILDRITARRLKAAADATREVVLSQEAADRTSLALLGGVLIILAASAVLAERRLARADEEARLRLEQLDAFAAHAAHDLKGPLGPAFMAVAAMRKWALDEQERKVVEGIARSQERMLTIVEGLLAFARSGTPPGSGDECAVVGDALHSLAPALLLLAGENRAQLALEVESGLLARASGAVLCSIVDNLARNAIVHLGDSERRHVDIRASRDGDQLQIVVDDTGPGIPPELVPRLFQPFTRGASAGPGTGLGLATVKRLVDAHGGSIGLHARAEGGTRAQVRLPLARPGRVNAS